MHGYISKMRVFRQVANWQSQRTGCIVGLQERLQNIRIKGDLSSPVHMCTILSDIITQYDSQILSCRVVFEQTFPHFDSGSELLAFSGGEEDDGSKGISTDRGGRCIIFLNHCMQSGTLLLQFCSLAVDHVG